MASNRGAGQKLIASRANLPQRLARVLHRGADIGVSAQKTKDPTRRKGSGSESHVTQRFSSIEPDHSENAVRPEQIPKTRQRGTERKMMERSHGHDEVKVARCELVRHEVVFDERDARFRTIPDPRSGESVMVVVDGDHLLAMLREPSREKSLAATYVKRAPAARRD